MPWKPTVHRPAGAKPAAEVKRELDRLRPGAGQRGYDARWRKARARYLAEHPWCPCCQAEGRLTRATVVDHVVPHRGNAGLFWNETNWQALCKRCHDRKTVADGRWGREVRVRRRYGCDVRGRPPDLAHSSNRQPPGGGSARVRSRPRKPGGSCASWRREIRAGGIRA